MSELLEEAIVFYIKANYPHLLKTADLEQEAVALAGEAMLEEDYREKVVQRLKECFREVLTATRRSLERNLSERREKSQGEKAQGSEARNKK